MPLSDILNHPYFQEYVQKALKAADESIAGKYKGITYPQIPLELFSQLTPDAQTKYITGMHRLPDPVLSNFFEVHPLTKWTNESIDQAMQPWTDILKIGLPNIADYK